MTEHNHRGPDPCPVCDYDPADVVKRLHPTEIRHGAKARAAMRKEPDP